MLSHLRIALRTLAKTPGFTFVAVLTLSLGLGMSTSAFSFANAFLLRLLPYPDSDALVRVFRTTRDGNSFPHSPGVCADLHNAISTFSGLSVYAYDSPSLGFPGRPAEQITGMQVSPSFLKVLGVQPVLGRDFALDDDQPGKERQLILSQRGWHKRFAGNPDVIGKTLRLDGENFTVIGVLPKSFDAPMVWNTVEYIRPFILWAGSSTNYSDAWVNLVGRVKPGVDHANAGSELATIGTRIAAQHPKELSGSSLRIIALHRSNLEGMNTTIVWLMTGLALLVLFVACANLASLQLARALGRIREMAIRSALGAGRRHIMAPLLWESMLLSLSGGLLGLVFAGWMNSWMGQHIFIGDETGLDFPLDSRVLGFSILITLLTGLAFGLIPAWLIARSPAAGSLKEGARGSTTGPGHNRLRSALIIGEIAISLILVCTAASFAIAGSQLTKRNLGWKPEGVFHGIINRPWNRYGTDAARIESDKALLQRLSTIPGIEKVALGGSSPLFGYFKSNNIIIEGADTPKPGQEPLAQMNQVSHDYFSVLGIPLKDGGFFTEDLKPDSPKVTIINESFARRFWPGQSAVGKRFRNKENQDWLQVIGVVGDARSALDLEGQNTALQYYCSLVQMPNNVAFIVARGSIDPEAMAEPIRKEISVLDPDLPVAQSGSMIGLIEKFLGNTQLIVLQLSSYAFMGLLISSIGIYGVLTHLANQRTRDIGVRLALGAGQDDITRMILLQGARLLGFGLFLGLLGSLGLSRMLQQAMPAYGLPGLWIQFATMFLISVVTLIACWLPAHRASRTDPLEALRSE